MNPTLVIDYANTGDVPFLAGNDRHVSQDLMDQKVGRREVLIARLDEAAVGFLRFNYFWDIIPIMNLLFVLAPYRRRGIGRNMVTFWEGQMNRCGHRRVLTSTQSNEQAQHFYRKLGYADIGGFVLPGEPLEIILYKSLA